jgi:multidrug efflux pump subunit AcrB
VRDGAGVQTNVVRNDGGRSVLLTMLKNGDASTLELVQQARQVITSIAPSLPPGAQIDLLFDQSRFVNASINTVAFEAVLASGLTALVMLLFLGSWRSTLIVVTSIPLSIMASIGVLWLMGQTINVMVLTGLAICVGILVDDATVEIENVHRLRHEKPHLALTDTILEGARQIAVPALVSTLAICIVFLPVLLLTDIARHLFVPMALAAVLAIATSYLLSRTLVPLMVQRLLAHELHGKGTPAQHGFARFQRGFEAGFLRLQVAYTTTLGRVLARRGWVLGAGALAMALAAAGASQLGREFFPTVDAGQLRLQVTAPSGLRIEETERVFARVEDEIRQVIPAADLDRIVSHIGVSYFAFNNAFGETGNRGTYDGEVLISLTADRNRAAPDYERRLRERLRAAVPDVAFHFKPADAVNQVLNFGSPSPIDVQVLGPDRAGNRALALAVAQRIAAVPGAVDVRLHQVLDAPQLAITSDRGRMAASGITQQQLASDVNVALVGSNVVNPAFFLDPQTGVQYPVIVRTPQRELSSVQDLQSLPVTTPSGPQTLGNLAGIERREVPAVLNRVDMQPVFNVYANVAHRDLGAVAGDIQAVVNEMSTELKAPNRVVIRGQYENMNRAFSELALGFLAAVGLVYLLLAVKFQHWRDPLAVIGALPGAVLGIVALLLLTGTPLSVPALMGAVMAVGIASANAILFVSFANDRTEAGDTPLAAALAAGHTRLRPILMTSSAMIAGMVPMAVGMGEGGEQMAPLARAVIGGLLLATLATLFLVPALYTALRGWRAHATPMKPPETSPESTSSLPGVGATLS